MEFKKINYSDLSSKQKESYNFQRLSALLANYGYTTMRLTDDWRGADFIAQHLDGKTFLKVQLKTRLSFYKKYNDKDIFIAFEEDNIWYLYPHDELLQLMLSIGKFTGTESWDERNGYNIPRIPNYLVDTMKKYIIE